MTKLYAVVTDDGYEAGTTIHGVYTSPELAQEAMRRYGADRIEEQRADVLPELQDGLYAWQVSLWNGAWTPKYSDVVKTDPKNSWCDEGRGTVYCFARSATEAAEIAIAEAPRLRQESKRREIRQQAEHLDKAVTFFVTRQQIINDGIGNLVTRQT